METQTHVVSGGEVLQERANPVIKLHNLKKTFKDLIARIFQHELDHLNGIIYLDKIETSKDIITEKEYLKKMAKEAKKKKK